MQGNYYVYIMTNNFGNVIYIGVTNDLARRVSEHKQKLIPGFTKKYNIDKLVYYEHFNNIKEAIVREKILKGWRRDRKNKLIQSVNSNFNDLSEEWGWNKNLKQGDPSLRSG